jgi:hypothetical protein
MVAPPPICLAKSAYVAQQKFSWLSVVLYFEFLYAYEAGLYATYKRFGSAVRDLEEAARTGRFLASLPHYLRSRKIWRSKQSLRCGRGTHSRLTRLGRALTTIVLNARTVVDSVEMRVSPTLKCPSQKIQKWSPLFTAALNNVTLAPAI